MHKLLQRVDESLLNGWIPEENLDYFISEPSEDTKYIENENLDIYVLREIIDTTYIECFFSEIRIYNDIVNNDSTSRSIFLVSKPTGIKNDDIINWLMLTHNLIKLEKIRFVSHFSNDQLLQKEKSSEEKMIMEDELVKRISQDEASNVSIILVFKSSIDARNFYNELNCAKIDESKELIYMLFISEIYIDSIKNDTFQYKDKNKKAKAFLNSIYTEKLLQIPNCVHCQELIDEDCTGVKFEGLIQVTEEEDIVRWVNWKKVCPSFYLKNMILDKAPKCLICEVSLDLMICLFCGHLACGREQSMCSISHFKDSKHFLSVSLNGPSIWDYKHDKFVHRVNLTGDIFYENNIEDVYHQQVQEMGDTLSLNFTVMLCEQLEQQQKYFENKIREIKDTRNIEINGKIDQELLEQSNKNYELRTCIEDLDKNLHINKKKQKKFLENIKHAEQTIICLKDDKRNYESHLEIYTETKQSDDDVEIMKINNDIEKENKLYAALKKKLEQLYEKLSNTN